MRRGPLSPLERGRLRTLIARMVVDDPKVPNRAIVEAFERESGIRVVVSAVARHRSMMRLPPRPMGNALAVARAA